MTDLFLVPSAMIRVTVNLTLAKKHGPQGTECPSVFQA